MDFGTILQGIVPQVDSSNYEEPTALWNGKKVSIDEFERLQEEEDKINRYKQSGVGERYLNKTLRDFIATTDEQKKNLEKVLRFVADVKNRKSRTLWLCGNAGTGKTLLASLCIRECGGRFCKSYQIQNELDDCRSFKATESKSQLIERYSSYKVLVIDEIAKIDNKAEVEYLFMILNERYERQLSTILITNKSVKELAEYIGKPLYDRFVENCTSIEFTGESYRKNEREE